MLPIPFNNPATYPGHSGVDFGQRQGTPFRASGPGKIHKFTYNSRSGYAVWVRYDGGPTVGYCHMPSHAACPPIGTRVSEGTHIGNVGWTGHVIPAGPQGAHLHAEIDGHATTAGFWKFFTASRVVGQGSAAGGKDPKPKPTPEPVPEEEEEEEDMAMKGAQYKNAAGTQVFMLFNEVSGFCAEHSGVDSTYNNPLAREWDTNSWPTITEGHAKVIKASLAQVRTNK